MSTVQALTELSHRADEVAAFCRETGEPIQVTHLAGDDLVLMSVEAYRRPRELAVPGARRQAAGEARRPPPGAARPRPNRRPPAAARGPPRQTRAPASATPPETSRTGRAPSCRAARSRP